MDDSFENPKRSHAVHTLISHKLLSKAQHSTGSSSSIRYGSSKGSVVMNRHRHLHIVYPNIANILNVTGIWTGNLKTPDIFRVSNTHHPLCWACVWGFCRLGGDGSGCRWKAARWGGLWMALWGPGEPGVWQTQPLSTLAGDWRKAQTHTVFMSQLYCMLLIYNGHYLE